MTEQNQQIDARQLLLNLSKSSKELGDRVSAVELTLEEASGGAEVVAAVEAMNEHLTKLTDVLYLSLQMQVSQLAPLTEHSDETVRDEAGVQISTLMQCQALIKPQFYEDFTGISATTGKELPGRVAGTPIDSLLAQQD